MCIRDSNTQGLMFNYILWFRSLCTIKRSTLSSRIYRIRVIFTSYKMIFHSWKVFYSTSLYQYYWVFLKSMFFSRNIYSSLWTIRHSYSCYLSLCWVRFFRSHNCHLKTYSSLEWRRIEYFFIMIQSIKRELHSWSFRSIRSFHSRTFNKLLNSRH